MSNLFDCHVPNSISLTGGGISYEGTNTILSEISQPSDKKEQSGGNHDIQDDLENIVKDLSPTCAILGVERIYKELYKIYTSNNSKFKQLIVKKELNGKIKINMTAFTQFIVLFLKSELKFFMFEKKQTNQYENQNILTELYIEESNQNQFEYLSTEEENIENLMKTVDKKGNNLDPITVQQLIQDTELFLSSDNFPIMYSFVCIIGVREFIMRKRSNRYNNNIVKNTRRNPFVNKLFLIFMKKLTDDTVRSHFRTIIHTNFNDSIQLFKELIHEKQIKRPNKTLNSMTIEFSTAFTLLLISMLAKHIEQSSSN